MKKQDSKPPPLPAATTNGKKKNDLVVYVYNVVEDEWQFINSLSTPQEKTADIRAGEVSTDCFYFAFASEQNGIYVSPYNISDEFQTYVQKLVKNKDVEVLHPLIDSHRICLDLIEDRERFNYIVNKAKDYDRLVLLSYSASPEFYDLKNAFTKAGLNVYTPEAPEIENAWTVNFFGSKSGIRQLAGQSAAQEPDFVMPEGVICVGKFDAAKIAANKYLKEKGVVIKTNKGCSGNGVLIFRENDLPNTYTECEKTIQTLLDKEPYWEKFPIVVESLVNVNPAIGNGFPNVEFKIAKNGRIDMLFYGSLVVNQQGNYLGMDIGEDTLNDRATARVMDTGFYIAERYSAAGYRGHFDVDMIAAKNNQIYVGESNTRNTGATDTFKIADKLIGKDFLYDSYIITRSHYKLDFKDPLSITEVLAFLKPILYSPSKKEGLILNAEHCLKEKQLTYTIFGKSKKRAYDIQEKLQQIIAQATK